MNHWISVWMSIDSTSARVEACGHVVISHDLKELRGALDNQHPCPACGTTRPHGIPRS